MDRLRWGVSERNFDGWMGIVGYAGGGHWFISGGPEGARELEAIFLNSNFLCSPGTWGRMWWSRRLPRQRAETAVSVRMTLAGADSGLWRQHE